MRSDFSRRHRDVGSAKDRWTGERPIHLIERRWNGLASISISVGSQKVTFYGTTIDSLRNGFQEALDRIERRDFLPSGSIRAFGSDWVYNFAHPVASRGTVFTTSHPANALYRNSIEAVFHDDGTVSAMVYSKRPWHLMQLGFAPGFFDGIRNYLPR